MGLRDKWGRVIPGRRSVVALAFLTLLALPAFSQDPAEILRNMEQVMRGDSQQAEMTMKIVRPRYEREVSMRSWAMGTDYSLILITAPSRDRGTAYLMRENDIWNYDPRIDRTTRLPSSMMAQSWMGSDFTNDDLVRDSDILDDYEHELIETEEYNGYESYVIELVPKPDTPIVWGKVKMWISVDGYMQLRIENYDQRDRLANTMELDRIEEISGRKLPTRITVYPAGKDNERTILEYSSIEFDIDLDESFFSQSNLQRLR
ncbi:MAG: outer membrane lipoprotein-sorting protein [Balneolaceae bacterium]|nr:outer membrane lipoprotein-sorting protein [Balneolaceae bacterium]MCH8548540.1 outer membrane lipoprotein-sorting protein [Balneolaceae bacterium]